MNHPLIFTPPDAFWNLDEIFHHSEYKNFSENGRRFILTEAQKVLKQRGNLKTDITSDTSLDLQKGLQRFQSLNELQPTGLLDARTIVALELTSLPDRADWTPTLDDEDKLGWWARNVSLPIKRLFGGGKVTAKVQ